MKLDEFDYNLPLELIAQEPAQHREASRLMTVDRTTGLIDEMTIADIASLFRPRDLLVVNDTRVIPARLFGRKATGGQVEIFLVRRLGGEGERWQVLIRASKSPQPGSSILLPDGMTAQVEDRHDEESWVVSFSPPELFEEWLETHGAMPLPPYIRREADAADQERYQTVFASNKGAVAAPTAGLHFTESLLNTIRARGIEISPLTLHVGLGTFMPVRVKDLSEHRMHREHFCIPALTAKAVAERRRNGGRVIAIGTTVARALEYAGRDDGTVAVGEGEADIFIYPGYRFKVVDALLTNFHLPKSTLLMLVSALTGKELLFKAYEEAVQRKFRFFSYGDAMFIS